MNTDSHPPPSPLIFPLPSIVERLDLPRLFPRSQPLEVELGAGDGSFLAQYASLHPDRDFIAVERLLGRLRKVERKGQRLSLSNLRAVRIEASYFLEHLLPPNSARALHIYFPDPWPKRRHHKHRLINDRFPHLARQALAPGGALYLRTDDAAYFSQMQSAFAPCPFFSAIPTPQSLAAVLTDFEREFLKRGVPTLRLAFQLAGP